MLPAGTVDRLVGDVCGPGGFAGMDAGENDRRLAGIGRRRDPRVNTEICRQHDALPVERRGDALPALAAGGDESGDAGDEDKGAQRIGIARGDARRRPARLEASRGGAWAFHSATEWESVGLTASASTIAVAGRCRSPLPWSSRRSPSAKRPFVCPNKDFRDQGAAVVGSGLHRAVGARRHDGEEVAGLRRNERTIERDEIAGFADRPDDVGDDSRRARGRLAHRADVVVGVVERGANEVVHPGIDDDEGLGLAALHIEHARA